MLNYDLQCLRNRITMYGSESVSQHKENQKNTNFLINSLPKTYEKLEKCKKISLTNLLA